VTASVEVVVDRTVTGFAATAAALSPNGDGVADTTTFTFGLALPAAVRLEIVSAGLVVATPLAPTFLQGGSLVVDWNGTANGAPLPDGAYDAVLTVTGPAGDVAVTLPIRVDTTPPSLELLDAAKLRFRLSEPAVVTLLVNGRRIVKNEPAGAFSVPRGAAPVQTLSAAATDLAGNVSATLEWP
jgi:hypothetical protein